MATEPEEEEDLSVFFDVPHELPELPFFEEPPEKGYIEAKLMTSLVDLRPLRCKNAISVTLKARLLLRRKPDGLIRIARLLDPMDGSLRFCVECTEPCALSSVLEPTLQAMLRRVINHGCRAIVNQQQDTLQGLLPEHVVEDIVDRFIKFSFLIKRSALEREGVDVSSSAPFAPPLFGPSEAWMAFVPRVRFFAEDCIEAPEEEGGSSKFNLEKLQATITEALSIEDDES